MAADGTKIAVHDLGGSGPPLLLAHATGLCGMVFAPLAAALAHSFHCYAPDLRGHGVSGRPADGSFAWSGFALDVLAAVDVLGAQGCYSVGHSCGGAALLLAELARPGTIGGMYLYEPIVFSNASHEPMSLENPMSAAALRRREVFTSREEAYANYSSKPPFSSLRADSLRAYVDYGLAETGDGTVRLQCRPSDEGQVFAMAAAHDTYDRLGEIGCPVTIAGGGSSDTFVDGSLLASRTPRGRSETLQGLGHFGPLDDPSRVASHVLQSFGQ